MRHFAALIIMAFTLSACVTDGNGGNKALFGTILGGAGGGFLGSKIGSGRGQLAATAAGALLGALVGNSVGSSLDRVDQLSAQRATNTALSRAPVGQQIAWSNPRSGNRGTVTTIRDGYQPRTNRYCREYQTTVIVGGQRQSGFGTACRQPDGSWQVVNQ